MRQFFQGKFKIVKLVPFTVQQKKNITPSNFSRDHLSPFRRSFFEYELATLITASNFTVLRFHIILNLTLLVLPLDSISTKHRSHTKLPLHVYHFGRFAPHFDSRLFVRNMQSFVFFCADFEFRKSFEIWVTSALAYSLTKSRVSYRCRTARIGDALNVSRKSGFVTTSSHRSKLVARIRNLLRHPVFASASACTPAPLVLRLSS